MNSADLLIGVDGGGSKTVAWLATRDDLTERGVIGRGLAGASNLQAVGFAVATAHLEQAIDAAFADAKRTRRRVASACIGLAGAGRENDRTSIQQWAARRDLAVQTTISNDALPVLYAGTPDGWGVALVSGTGSFAFGRTAAGVTGRCGGWGPLFGDEGSGYAIALAGLRAAAQAADGRSDETMLLERFLRHFNLSDPGELVSTIYVPTFARSDIARLAGIVFAASDEQDPVAVGIIRDAATVLTQIVGAVVRKLQVQDRPVPLALAGGVLLHHPKFRQLLCDELAANRLHFSPTSTVRDPVAGALTIALRAIA